MGLHSLGNRLKWMPSQQSIEPGRVGAHCGALQFLLVTLLLSAFGLYLCRVNWTEKKGGGGGEAGTDMLGHLGHQVSHLPWKDKSTSHFFFVHPTLCSLFSLRAPMN